MKDKKELKTIKIIFIVIFVVMILGAIIGTVGVAISTYKYYKNNMDLLNIKRKERGKAGEELKNEYFVQVTDSVPLTDSENPRADINAEMETPEPIAESKLKYEVYLCVPEEVSAFKQIKKDGKCDGEVITVKLEYEPSNFKLLGTKEDGYYTAEYDTSNYVVYSEKGLIRINNYTVNSYYATNLKAKEYTVVDMAEIDSTYDGDLDVIGLVLKKKDKKKMYYYSLNDQKMYYTSDNLTPEVDSHYIIATSGKNTWLLDAREPRILLHNEANKEDSEVIVIYDKLIRYGNILYTYDLKKIVSGFDYYEYDSILDRIFVIKDDIVDVYNSQGKHLETSNKFKNIIDLNSSNQIYYNNNGKISAYLYSDSKIVDSNISIDTKAIDSVYDYYDKLPYDDIDFYGKEVFIINSLYKVKDGEAYLDQICNNNNTKCDVGHHDESADYMRTITYYNITDDKIFINDYAEYDVQEPATTFTEHNSEEELAKVNNDKTKAPFFVK